MIRDAPRLRLMPRKDAAYFYDDITCHLPRAMRQRDAAFAYA